MPIDDYILSVVGLDWKDVSIVVAAAMSTPKTQLGPSESNARLVLAHLANLVAARQLEAVAANGSKVYTHVRRPATSRAA